MEDINELWKQAYTPRRIILPSGLPVLVRPVKLESLVMAKRIPLTLVQKLQTKQPKTDGRYRIEDRIEQIEAVNAVVIAAVVEPRVTADGADGTVCVDDIDVDDRYFIFGEANRPAATYAMFPGRPDAGGDAAPDSEGVREAAE